MESKYTHEVLEPVIVASSSLAEVMRRLGLRPTGGNHRHISRRLRVLGISTKHFGRRAYDMIDETVFREAVQSSASYRQVLKKLGGAFGGGSYQAVRKKIAELGLPTEHFKFQGWCRGLTKETDERVARVAKSLSLTDRQVFCCNSRASSFRVRTRILEQGRKYKCSCCGISEWQGHPLTLHLDHINGVNNDNRKENLRFLCPNCHQQTSTWGNKNGQVEELEDSGDLGSPA